MAGAIKFSVCIPAYKSQYLFECISSILNQSYSEFELIIINDLSPYPVDEVIAQFNDNRIRYYKNEKNFGAENVVKNFNKCLEQAEGEFFVLMGDDDKMEPDYLEEFLKLIYKYRELDVYHCRSKIIDESSKPLILTPSWPEFESVYDNIWHRMTQNRVKFIADFVFRTATLKSNGGFYFLPLAWNTDDITVYIATGKKGIAHINKPLLDYRKHPSTISSSGDCELKLKATILMQSWFHSFFVHEPEKEEDIIIYNYLKTNIDKFIQKQKIYIISSSMHKNLLKKIVHYLHKRKKYKVTILEIAFSFITFLKEKLSR